MKELKWRNWNEGIEVKELKWMISNECQFLHICRPRVPKLLRTWQCLTFFDVKLPAGPSFSWVAEWCPGPTKALSWDGRTTPQAHATSLSGHHSYNLLLVMASLSTWAVATKSRNIIPLNPGWVSNRDSPFLDYSNLQYSRIPELIINQRPGNGRDILLGGF